MEHKKPGINHHQQRNLRLLLASQDYNYHQVSTRVAECRSQRRIERFKRFKQMESGSISAQENMSSLGYPRYKPI